MKSLDLDAPLTEVKQKRVPRLDIVFYCGALILHKDKNWKLHYAEMSGHPTREIILHLPEKASTGGFFTRFEP